VNPANDPDSHGIVLCNRRGTRTNQHEIETDLDKSGQTCAPDATIPSPEQQFLSKRLKFLRSNRPARFGYPPFKTA